MPLSKAFRYVNIAIRMQYQLDSVSMLYEYADVKERGSFRCSDEQINKIYDVSKYTLAIKYKGIFY